MTVILLIQVMIAIAFLSLPAAARADKPEIPATSVVLERLWQIGDDDENAHQIFGLIVDVCIDREPRRQSAAERQAVYDWATVNPHGNLPGTDFQIEKFDKSIMGIPRAYNGELWVLTSRGVYDRPQGALGDSVFRFVRWQHDGDVL